MYACLLRVGTFVLHISGAKRISKQTTCCLTYFKYYSFFAKFNHSAKSHKKQETILIWNEWIWRDTQRLFLYCVCYFGAWFVVAGKIRRQRKRGWGPSAHLFRQRNRLAAYRSVADKTANNSKAQWCTDARWLRVLRVCVIMTAIHSNNVVTLRND